MNWVAINIKWDTDGNEAVAKSLPQNILFLDGPIDSLEAEDYIGQTLSVDVGFCHYGYELTEAALIDFDTIHVGKIIHLEG